MELQLTTADGQVVKTISGEMPFKEIKIDGVVYKPPEPPDPLERYIDLDQEMWEMIKTAARENKWMPEEYCMNDWVSDVCSALREGKFTRPDTQLMELVKDLKLWNESGGILLPGSALHKAAKRQLSYMEWYEKLWFPWTRAVLRAVAMTKNGSFKYLAEITNDGT